MKYFTFDAITINGQTTVSAFERADEQTALSAHFATLASALITEGVEEIVSRVTDSDGFEVVTQFVWKKKQEQ